MAVAPEVLEEGAAWRAASRASGQVRRAPAAAQKAYGAVSSPSAAAQTITKLLWAIAVGLIALQVAAEATGQRWSFALPGGTGKHPVKEAYVPLYSGQASAAMPGVFGPAGASTSTQLSGSLSTPGTLVAP